MALAVADLAILFITIIGRVGSAIIRNQFNATVINLPDDQAATMELDKGSTYGLFYGDDDDTSGRSVISPGDDGIGMKSNLSSTEIKDDEFFSAFSSRKSGTCTVDCNGIAGASVGEIIAPLSAMATLLSLFGAVDATIMAVVGLTMGISGMA